MKRAATSVRAATVVLMMIALAAMPARAWAQPGEVKPQTRWFYKTSGVHPGGTLHAALEVRLSNHFHVQANKPNDEFMVPTVVTVTPAAGVSVREVVYPKAVNFRVLGFDEPLLVFEDTFVVGVALDVGGAAGPGRIPFKATLDYQACNDKVCLAPTSVEIAGEITVVPAGTPLEAGTGATQEVFAKLAFSENPTAVEPPPARSSGAATAPPEVQTHECDVLADLRGFTVLAAGGGLRNPEEFVAFIDDAESGRVETNPLEGQGPLAILLLVVVGGVLLNLTPCVLPLVPINLAIIGAGTRAGSRSRGFALGGTYGLAMALVYGALGLIVIFTATTFGAINSTIWFNVAIAVLFVVLALGMFDVISIDFSRYQSKLDASTVGKSGTFALAFAMGAISALLAGACVAPVVIQVIVYSSDQYSKGTSIALALPFFLGLGMALPWPFAGAGLSCLPKPGKWMVRVKQAMGLFILAFAVYYVYTAWQIWDSKRVDPQAVHTAIAEKLKEGWTASICDGLAQARAENKPVLIDMWATWCKNCLVMDKTTFKDEQVLERLEGYVKIKFQAQDLNASPAKEILALFDGIGLPAYAILRPGTEGFTTEAQRTQSVTEKR